MAEETIVYKITCLPNGKLYIGITRNTLIKRWQGHLCVARKPNPKTPLHKAMRSLGSEQFQVEQIEVLPTRAEAGAREKYLIEAMNTKVPTGYNVADGGDGGSWRRGFVMPDSQRRNISAALTGKKKSAEAVEKLRQRMLGWKQTPEHTEKIRQAGLRNKGRKHTEANTLHFHIRMLRRSLELSPESQSGFRAVCWEKNGWLVRYGHRGKRIYVGRFKTAEEAYAAYRAAATLALDRSERDYESLTGQRFNPTKSAAVTAPTPVLAPPPIFIEAPKSARKARALKPLPLFEYAEAA